MGLKAFSMNPRPELAKLRSTDPLVMGAEVHSKMMEVNISNSHKKIKKKKEMVKKKITIFPFFHQRLSQNDERN